MGFGISVLVPFWLKSEISFSTRPPYILLLLLLTITTEFYFTDQPKALHTRSALLGLLPAKPPRSQVHLGLPSLRAPQRPPAADPVARSSKAALARLH